MSSAPAPDYIGIIYTLRRLLADAQCNCDCGCQWCDTKRVVLMQTTGIGDPVTLLDHLNEAKTT